jgi:hypothetical protein
MNEIPDPPSYDKIQAIGKQVFGSDSFKTTLHNRASCDIVIPACDEAKVIVIPANGSVSVIRTPEGYRNLTEGE